MEPVKVVNLAGEVIWEGLWISNIWGHLVLIVLVLGFLALGLWLGRRVH